MLAGLGYVAVAAAQSWPHIPSIELNLLNLAAIVGSLFAYMATTALGGEIWRHLLVMAGIRIGRMPAVAMIMMSQIGKYLPGGFAQYFARGALAKQLGVRPAAVISTIALESFAAVIAAAFVAFFCALIEQSAIAGLWPSHEPTVRTLQCASIGAGACLALGVLFWPKLRDRVRREMAAVRLSALRLGVCFGYYAITFVVCGLVLVLSSHVFAPGKPVGIMSSIQLFAVAWIIGFVSITAPGGIGVRDAILIVGLGPMTGRAEAVGAVILARIIMVGSDVLSLFAGAVIFHLSGKDSSALGGEGK